MGIDVIGATTNLIQSAKTLGNNFGSVASGVSVPAPNILSNYASYNYVISLHPLTPSEFNFPNESYIKGKVLPIICKSAMADPTNRIQTPNFGKQDFFINNLTFETFIGHTSPKTTSVATVQFDIIEPYSIGLFINSLQAAAIRAGYSTWMDAVFLVSVEFRGNTENGMLKKVPFSTRHIPIRFSTINIKATDQGTRYLCNAFATQCLALTTEFASLRTDVAIRGRTVQEVLQTGNESLQNVVNAKLQQTKLTGTPVADQIVIIFPKDNLISQAVAQSAGSPELKQDRLYVNPQPTTEPTAILQKLGINPSNLQQSASDINNIGSSKMGFDQKRAADQPSENPQNTWDPGLRIWIRGKLVPNWEEGSFKFSQDMDIPTAINQIILASRYPEVALAQRENGMITWWRVDTQVYYVQTKENDGDTGKMPKIAVYRVVPFKVHESKVTGPRTQGDGMDVLKARAVKRYDYIFTGKNTEVLKFNIDYNVGFANNFASDAFLASMGIARSEENSVGDNVPGSKPTAQHRPDGRPASGNDPAGANPTMQRQDATKNSMDGAGGVDAETALQRLAKTFHEAITNPYDMVMLDMEIMGDPYWFTTSGMGNFIAEPVIGFKDLNKDGSVNWQTTQVDCVINFRSPVDINQTTGLYNFAGPNHQDMTKDPKAGPAIGFTGAYCVNTVINYFRDGTFRQVLKGFRRNGQEFKTIATKENSLNSQNRPTLPGGTI